jgi:hypothetical protein
MVLKIPQSPRTSTCARGVMLLLFDLHNREEARFISSVLCPVALAVLLYRTSVYLVWFFFCYVQMWYIVWSTTIRRGRVLDSRGRPRVAIFRVIFLCTACGRCAALSLWITHSPPSSYFGQPGRESWTRDRSRLRAEIFQDIRARLSGSEIASHSWSQ